MTATESTATWTTEPGISDTGTLSTVTDTHGVTDTAEGSASLFSLEEKLSLLYWAGAAVVVLLAVTVHASALVLGALLLFDVYRFARTGRSAAVRVLEAAGHYRVLAERDRSASPGAALELGETLRQLASRAAQSGSALARRVKAASRRATSARASSGTSETGADAPESRGARPHVQDTHVEEGASHDAVVEEDASGAPTQSALAQRAASLHLPERATQWLDPRLPRTLGGWASEISGAFDDAGVEARARVAPPPASEASAARLRLVFLSAIATSALLGLFVHPLAFVLCVGLATDYALWRWCDTSLLADVLYPERAHAEPVVREAPAAQWANHEPAWREAA